ncbi:hypothetical protein EIP91_008879 [Steccherinum ochraceum]|uniref:Uncharacterized protein n=1 Tax=Steccherinum ochraceum TaxID=92696 RepID=A0A4R0S242_9APHY|nr:hypothetical protein EIP91_008879 [Steccherinum ochraceum]
MALVAVPISLGNLLLRSTTRPLSSTYARFFLAHDDVLPNRWFTYQTFGTLPVAYDPENLGYEAAYFKPAS